MLGGLDALRVGERLDENRMAARNVQILAQFRVFRGGTFIQAIFNPFIIPRIQDGPVSN